MSFRTERAYHASFLFSGDAGGRVVIKETYRPVADPSRQLSNLTTAQGLSVKELRIDILGVAAIHSDTRGLPQSRIMRRRGTLTRGSADFATTCQLEGTQRSSNSRKRATETFVDVGFGTANETSRLGSGQSHLP